MQDLTTAPVTTVNPDHDTPVTDALDFDWDAFDTARAAGLNADQVSDAATAHRHGVGG